MILLSGIASVEDAEPLLAALIDQPGCAIDVTGLDRAHLAIVQLLCAAGRPLVSKPGEGFLRDLPAIGLIQISPR
ncbi:hypothetical protein [Sphingomonas montanisoli]|uniref:STAS domain-containing protein n=1 Tax=Sphingomonas montanisoli TaxID=2606412 RepID=A0A5D9CF40_9SPHN|nr:hypothetical protein [Sphingomonas montanisoli]TZG28715.1 hypothetical protein FYJ91_00775 [Sphingomonas montanisoli]